MSEKLIISTILLTNGQEERLKSSIDTIIGQDYPNKELIIVSSTPNDIFGEYQENPMVRIYIQPELNHNEARDFALEQVPGHSSMYQKDLSRKYNHQILVLKRNL